MPPAEAEGVWALPIERNLSRLDNTPWFARGVAADDVVEASPDRDGGLWFLQPRNRGERWYYGEGCFTEERRRLG